MSTRSKCIWALAIGICVAGVGALIVGLTWKSKEDKNKQSYIVDVKDAANTTERIILQMGKGVVNSRGARPFWTSSAEMNLPSLIPAAFAIMLIVLVARGILMEMFW